MVGHAATLLSSSCDLLCTFRLPHNGNPLRYKTSPPVLSRLLSTSRPPNLPALLLRADIGNGYTPDTKKPVALVTTLVLDFSPELEA